MACACRVPPGMLLADGSAMGDILPRFVTSADVEDLKRRIDPAMHATNVDARACAALAPEEQSAWAQFFGSWQAFRSDSVSFWRPVGPYETALKYETELARWQERIASRCSLSSPKVVPQSEGQATSADIVTAVKLVAGAVLVVGIVYGVRSLAR